MQRAIRPLWLLRLADQLAYRHDGRGQPRNTNLRGAVSAAYYALFHAVGLAVANHMVPRGDDHDRFGLIRSIDHRAVVEVCRWIDSVGGPEHARSLVQSARSSADVTDLANWFRQLQEDRYSADYDHEADFTKARVQSLIDLARDAVERIGRLTGTRELEALLALIALKTSIR